MTYLNLIDDFIKSEKDRYPRSIIDYFWNKLINEYGFKQNNHEFHPQLFSGNLWITFSFVFFFAFFPPYAFSIRSAKPNRIEKAGRGHGGGQGGAPTGLKIALGQTQKPQTVLYSSWGFTTLLGAFLSVLGGV